MKKSINNKLTKLLTNLNNLTNIEALNKIQIFKEINKIDPEYSSIENILLSKEAYYLKEANKFDEALQLHNHLIEKELEKNKPNHSSIGNDYIATLKLLRLSNLHQKSFELSITILNQFNFDWNIEIWIFNEIILTNKSEDLENYKEKIKNIEKNLKFICDDDLNLREKIKLMVKENIRASNEFTQIISQKSDKNNKKLLLKDFIFSEKVGFYKKLAEKYYNQLNDKKHS
ncbi:hypothetical protein KIH41_17970 [Litoribacter ruber]|uniref:hypothetical protein n=1 Tax=Litoribacter ruber TaxID=702568 RepID=UPI001BDA029B|nr:hypothetical protein [Litoribacter ruber]MBT0813175.1 hypothetical protein [Litoribacter ruber]